MRKKVVAGFLVLCMCLLAFPANALAATVDLTVTPAEGDTGIHVPNFSTDDVLVYDLMTKFNVGWADTTVAGYFTWRDNLGNRGGGSDFVDGSLMDISGYPAGLYTFVFDRWSVAANESIGSARLTILIRRVTATVGVDGLYGPYNPETLSAGYINDELGLNDATISWTLTGPGGFTQSATDQTEQEALEALGALLAKDANGRYVNPDLVEGEYTLSNTAAVTTQFGNVVEDTKSTNFVIRYPFTTTTVDREENPTSITGTQTILDSRLTWEITGNDGTVVASGEGDNVPPGELNLPEGSYTVTFTETSPEGLTHVSSGGFVISAVVDSQEPSSAAGGSSQSSASSANNTGGGTGASTATTTPPPATGDSANLAIIFFLMGIGLVSFAGTSAVLIRSRRQAGKKKN